MKWEPWVEFQKELIEEILPIKEPPCKDCKNWRPVRKYSERGIFNGVELCRAEEQHTDFSCYEIADSSRESK